MSLRTATATWVLLTVIAGGTLAQQRTFRDATLLVPVDVRIIDGNGKPVTGLRASDFTIKEDGLQQPIAHFEERLPISVRGEVPRTDESGRAGVEPQASEQGRTFLIVLGRGRLEGPARGLDAVIEFVKSGLAPLDHVGVVAYDRATDLTRDRDSVIRLLERYRQGHESVEARLDHWFGAMSQVLFGAREPPPGIQAEIDALFDGPGLPPLRRTAALSTPRATALSEFDWTTPDVDVTSMAAEVPVAATRDDVEKLYAAINYLRFVSGEKHILFLSEEGLLNLGRSEDSDSIAAVAADARVTLSPVHTTGIATRWERGPRNSVVLQGPTWSQRWALLDSRSMAQITGGLSSAYRYAADAIREIDAATRSAYVLAYYSSNRRMDGRFRRIEVAVNRPGVRVMYRQGYYANAAPIAYDRRTVMAHARITSAAAQAMLIRDLPVGLRASYASRGRDGWRVRAEVEIDPRQIRFRTTDGRRVAALNVAVFVGDRDQELVGETWQQVDLSLDDAAWGRVARESIAVVLLVECRAAGGRVKGVVYDYSADRVGTTVRDVR